MLSNTVTFRPYKIFVGKLLLYYKPEVEAYVRNLSLPDIPSQDDSSTEKGWRERPEMQPIIEVSIVYYIVEDLIRLISASMQSAVQPGPSS